MKIFLRLAVISFAFTSCVSKFGKVMKSKDNEYKYKMAEQYYESKQYTKAQQVYDGLMTYMRGTSRYEDMYYKYAYTSYYVKDYTNAEMLFKNYTETFPTGKYLEDASYMRGDCLYKNSPRAELDQTPTRKCLAVMQQFVVSFPESSRVADAQKIIDACNDKLENKFYLSCKLYFDTEQYRAAVKYFDLLMDDYPDSKKMDFYLLGEIKSQFEYAKRSIFAKRLERYRQVLTFCTDFDTRFADSKYKSQVEQYVTLANNEIKILTDEQNTQTSKS